MAHEVGDDAVEAGSLVAEALLAGAQGTEVLGRLGNDIATELCERRETEQIFREFTYIVVDGG